MVILAAKTGRDNTSKKTVMKYAQRKIGKLKYSMPCPKANTVVIKLIPPIIEAALAKCSEKIAQSIVADVCPTVERGGYTVHLHLAPLPTNIDITIIISEGSINQ
jgi:hypothetical protein